MLYLYALPLVLLASALLSATLQQIVSSFVDLVRVERHVWMAFVAWSLGGWMMEQRAAERVAALYEACDTHISQKFDALREMVMAGLSI